MRFIQYSTTTCVIKEIIEIPGETPEEIEDNYFDNNYEVISEGTIDDIDDDRMVESLYTESGEEVWSEGLEWDRDVVYDNM